MIQLGKDVALRPNVTDTIFPQGVSLVYDFDGKVVPCGQFLSEKDASWSAVTFLLMRLHTQRSLY